MAGRGSFILSIHIHGAGALLPECRSISSIPEALDEEKLVRDQAPAADGEPWEAKRIDLLSTGSVCLVQRQMRKRIVLSTLTTAKQRAHKRNYLLYSVSSVV